MSQTARNPVPANDRAAVLTKAVVRAAEGLGLNGGDLAAVLGVSAPTVSRMRKGVYTLDPAKKEFELGALFVRYYRSLDAIAGGAAGVRRAWVRGANTALGGAPIDLMKSVSGLTNGLAYLDARRAPL
ncbi:MAG: antitoxin Xre-like helix-turn-helix domain-containing protein [Parvularculaceae bacterium]